jgi:hypothetical protein
MCVSHLCVTRASFCMISTVEVKRICHFPVSKRKCCEVAMFCFVVFIERYLIRIGEKLWRLAVSHAVPAGTLEMRTESNLISECAVESDIR